MLPLCLKAIQRQDYKGEFEIIVVDNASTDSTAKIADSFGAKVHYESQRGVVFARIAGFKAASGTIIASTDADTIVPENWLTLIEEALRDNQYSGVIGAYTLCNVNSISKKIIQVIVPFFRTIDRFFGPHFAGANFAIYKKAYEEVGGFNTKFLTGEDLDLSYRLRKSGYKLRVSYNILVRTSARRLNEGVWTTLVNYIIRNWLSLVFFHHPFLSRVTIVREEPSEIEEIIGV